MAIRLGKLDLFLKLLALEGYASDIKGDRGGATKYGIASNIWPEEYAKLDDQGWNLDSVFLFYNRNFMEATTGFRRVLNDDSGLAALLFLGRVHGVGIRHYTLLVQQILNRETNAGLKEDGSWGPRTLASTLEYTAFKSLVPAIADNAQWLKDKRIRAVGIPEIANGIANRVDRELNFASETNRGQLFRVA